MKLNGLLLIGLLAALPLAARAQDYYVAPDGDDAAPGTLEKPLKDPVKAARKLNPGDTLYFRAGEYRCKTNGIIGLAPSRDGEEGKPITFKNHDNEHVKIDVAAADWGVTNNGFSYIVFDGFEITGGTKTYNMKISAHYGRAKKGTGHHVTIRNCEVHHSQNENIFSAETPYLTVENCYLHHSSRSHGLYLQHGCHNAVIRNVTSEHNYGNSGTQLNASKGEIKNALVENCLLRYNAHGFSLMGVIDSTFQGNVLFNNGYDGPRGSGWREIIMKDGSVSKEERAKGLKGTMSKGNTFENNTVVNLVPKGHKLGNLLDVREGTTGCIFRNNIFAVRGKPLFSLKGHEGFAFENNCLWNIGGGEQVDDGGSLADFAKANGFKVSEVVTGDPTFEDMEKGDLGLKEGSPCVDAGVKTESERQAAGKGPDLGALERGVEAQVGCKLPWKKTNGEK